MAGNVEQAAGSGDREGPTGFDFLARRPLSSLARHTRKGSDLADAPLNGIEAELMGNRSPYGGMNVDEMRAAMDREASERRRGFEAHKARLGPELMAWLVEIGGCDPEDANIDPALSSPTP